MSAMVSETAPTAVRSVPWWAHRRLILIFSVIVIPIALSALLNSYGPLTVDSALRMAFATIAAQTVAILGALAALVVTVTHRRSVAGVVLFALILVCVVTLAISTMGGAGDLLLNRLDLIAEVDRLN